MQQMHQARLPEFRTTRALAYSYMAQSSTSSDVLLINSERGVSTSVLSRIHEDDVPLKVRMKRKAYLNWIVQNREPQSMPNIGNYIAENSMDQMDTNNKNEDPPLDMQGIIKVLSSSCFTEEEMEDNLLPVLAAENPKRESAQFSHFTTEESGSLNLYLENKTLGSYSCLPRDCLETVSSTCMQSNQVPSGSSSQMKCSMVEPKHGYVLTSCQYPPHKSFNSKVAPEYLDRSLVGPAGDALAPSGGDFHSITVKTEIHNDFSDDDQCDLDHVMLKDRQRLLLIRKLSQAAKPSFEDALHGLQEAFLGLHEPFVDSVMQTDTEDGNKMSSLGENSSVAGSSPLHQILSVTGCRGAEPTNLITVERNLETHESASFMMPSMTNSNAEDNFAFASSVAVPTSSSFAVGQVKVETIDESDPRRTNTNHVPDFCFNIINKVKCEIEDPANSSIDFLDHMCLKDRMKLLKTQKLANPLLSENQRCRQGVFHSVPESCSVEFESARTTSAKRPRKRKKTVTGSVEIALEEDAPGLLQVLIEKGVVLDEIRLYGEEQTDEALDDSSIQDNFAELEAVIAKLFAHRPSLLKLAPIRHSKVSKPTYCLACLISLVDQTRYLQRRKWPVEWGWCRDLQSFIFVFERHNRIVLERPEYGYATYFFEIVESLPIDWQVRRLVIAMKLSSCSRINLIENKSLLIGEDLTEGEARVLMEYGWTPNTGLGTMLNYYDRVVHDRKNEREKDRSEWRGKIGKLLMTGYYGGSIVTTDIPKKAAEYKEEDDGSPHIKSEA